MDLELTDLVNELARKRGKLYKAKDPEKFPVMNQSEFNSSYRFGNSSSKNIKNIVTDFIMMKDQQACLHILN